MKTIKRLSDSKYDWLLALAWMIPASFLAAFCVALAYYPTFA